MPVFAYQSFNATSSNVHDLKSIKGQHFTRETQKHQVNNPNLIQKKERHGTLEYPTAQNNYPAKPVFGPPALLQAGAADGSGKDKMDTDQYTGAVAGKMQQILQGLCRETGQIPVVLCLGEIDTSHQDFSFLSNVLGPPTGVTSNPKACQSFSSHAPTGEPILQCADGIGWHAVNYLDFTAVFVHVPNDNAKSESKLIDFYEAVWKKVTSLGHTLDVLMGDTNQGSDSVTARCLNLAVKRAKGEHVFEDAHPRKIITPMNTHNLQFGGTNSVGKKKFDVAVYNTTTVCLEDVAYWTQQANVDGNTVAFTDHMGIAVELNKQMEM